MNLRVYYHNGDDNVIDDRRKLKVYDGDTIILNDGTKHLYVSVISSAFYFLRRKLQRTPRITAHSNLSLNYYYNKSEKTKREKTFCPSINSHSKFEDF
jgi:hypothetical protein